MVNYKKSVGAVALSATVVAGQNAVNNGSSVIGGGNPISNVGNNNNNNNGNQFVNLNQTNAGGVQFNFNDIVNGDQVGGDKNGNRDGDSGPGGKHHGGDGNHHGDKYGFDYTTVIPGLKPTGGWVDHTYTFHQVCPTPCGKPEIPMGWEYHTTVCEHGCGPKPTPVKVLHAPWGPPPCDEGPDCHYKPDHKPMPPKHDWKDEPVCDTCHVAIVEYCPPPMPDCEDDSCIPEPVSYRTVVDKPTNLPPAPKDCDVCQKPMAPPSTPTAPSTPQKPAMPAQPQQPQQPAMPPTDNKPQQPQQPPMPPTDNKPQQPQTPPVAPQPPTDNKPIAPACVDCVPAGNGSMPVVPVVSGSEKTLAGAATFLMACGVAIAALL